MKKTSISVFAMILMAMFLSACAAATQKPEKRLPQEVISPTPLPYTGEVGMPKAPEDTGLQVFQLNDDGTSQEVAVGGDTSAADKTPVPAEVADKGMVITTDGFVPPFIAMKVGEKLMIQNMDAVEHKPSSDPHPAHTDCPELNSGKALAANEFYTVTVSEPKTCGVHDHLNPEMKATITVTE